MITQIAYYHILGLPLVGYGGIITLCLFLLTASAGYLNYKGYKIIPFNWHPRLAITAIIFALFHGFLGLSILLGF